MTKEAIRLEMQRRLPEYFDGYILVARVAGTNNVVIAAECETEHVRRALEVGMTGILVDLQNQE